ncbi:1-phosphofructokinase [Williamsoniiplasma lucivorax]|uniref:1-phosphofructokinase n=1 Tax=Williamsoniiplasma lucivorax TaxID=209274 RepID=A0A2S5RA14_9MOLU|nr:1-phosphofructokinase [Williamsoniiplasma lucivorax]PPE04140.1 1-phosphofructokinase [Williamsoniiplasma lucivorax]
MIYTLTLNPAIDHIILTNQKLELSVTNYYQDEYQVVGGKGINAGVILNNLGVQTMAIGILGEKNKDIFFDKFKEINLKTKFFLNSGSTRVNYKIKNLASKQETELNGLGFETQTEILNQLIFFLKENLKKEDIVVLTGSVARGISSTIYQELGQLANEKDAIFICDANKELLLNALKAKPYLIKPNLEEICSTLNLEFKPKMNLEEIKPMVRQLQTLGAQNILVSMGSQGSLFFDNKKNIYKVGIAHGELMNSVGAGDSMLAGFVYGLAKKLTIEQTLQYAAASGGATAFTKWIATKEMIEELVDQINIEKIGG